MRHSTRVRVATIAACAALLAAIIGVSLAVRLHQRARDVAYIPPPWDVPAPAPEPEEPVVGPACAANATLATPPAPPPPLPPEDVQLVFTAAGETYVALDEIDMPPHGEPRLFEDDAETAVADIASRDLPADLRQLQRHGMIVDGTCHARVTGFAVVARLRGVPRDASDDFDEWTAPRVMDYGGSLLAARIEDCTGTFARDAKHSPITVFDVSDSMLADKAPERLLASPPVADAQDHWQRAERDGRWFDAHDATLNFRTFVDPRSNTTWVLAHAYRYEDCGEVGGNVLGLYRVDGDELTTVIERGAGRESYDQLIDVDGDGEPELVSSSTWSSSIERMTGDAEVSLYVHQLGCGC